MEERRGEIYIGIRAMSISKSRSILRGRMGLAGSPLLKDATRTLDTETPSLFRVVSLCVFQTSPSFVLQS